MHALGFHRRRLRRTVWLTAMAWCFALFSGVVNACLLAPAGAARIEAALHELRIPPPMRSLRTTLPLAAKVGTVRMARCQRTSMSPAQKAA